MPSLTTSLARPFRRSRQTYEINPPDQLHNVVYLGNVLTIMAKGEQSVERPLQAIWRSYSTRKRDVPMKLSVTRQGLKVETKQIGITEYWAHRITYCCAPPEYPRVFCWVYKHEGKRMKPELRCHAVLCKKQSEPARIANTLTSYLQAALQEYKREKLAMEKARKNSISMNGELLPRRKLMLQTGTLNFRPPVNRSKSAPRLGSIDEEDEADEDEEEEVEVEMTNNIPTSVSDCEFDESADLDSFAYREIPLADENRSDRLSSASTSTLSSTHSSDVEPAKTFRRQLSLCSAHRRHFANSRFEHHSEGRLQTSVDGIVEASLNVVVSESASSPASSTNAVQEPSDPHKTTGLTIGHEESEVKSSTNDVSFARSMTTNTTRTGNSISRLSTKSVKETTEVSPKSAEESSKEAKVIDEFEEGVVLEEDELPDEEDELIKPASGASSCASSDDGFVSSASQQEFSFKAAYPHAPQSSPNYGEHCAAGLAAAALELRQHRWHCARPQTSVESEVLSDESGFCEARRVEDEDNNNVDSVPVLENMLLKPGASRVNQIMNQLENKILLSKRHAANDVNGKTNFANKVKNDVEETTHELSNNTVLNTEKHPMIANHNKTINNIGAKCVHQDNMMNEEETIKLKQQLGVKLNSNVTNKLAGQTDHTFDMNVMEARTDAINRHLHLNNNNQLLLFDSSDELSDPAQQVCRILQQNCQVTAL